MNEQTPEGQEKNTAITKEDLLPKRGDSLPIALGLRNGTQSLFYEFRHQTTSKEVAPYTLKDYDITVGGVTYASMYMLYMACDSEYEAAIRILGSYSHWKRLASTKWFSEYLARWELERNIRDEALARSILVALVEKGNVTAARTVFTNSKTHKPDGPGRPEKGGKRGNKSGSAELDEMLGRVDNS